MRTGAIGSLVRSLVLTGLILPLASCDRATALAPTETYANGRCGPAPVNWMPQGNEFGELMTVELIEVDNDRVKWDRVPISQAMLEKHLLETSERPFPFNVAVVFNPRTRCDKVEAIRRTIEVNSKCGTIQACVEYSNAEWAANEPPSPSDSATKD